LFNSAIVNKPLLVCLDVFEVDPSFGYGFPVVASGDFGDNVQFGNGVNFVDVNRIHRRHYRRLVDAAVIGID
jgi:hypothetical protein